MAGGRAPHSAQGAGRASGEEGTQTCARGAVLGKRALEGPAPTRGRSPVLLFRLPLLRRGARHDVLKRVPQYVAALGVGMVGRSVGWMKPARHGPLPPLAARGAAVTTCVAAVQDPPGCAAGPQAGHPSPPVARKEGGAEAAAPIGSRAKGVGAQGARARAAGRARALEGRCGAASAKMGAPLRRGGCCARCEAAGQLLASHSFASSVDFHARARAI